VHIYIYIIYYIEEPTLNDNLFDFKIDCKTKADCVKKSVEIKLYIGTYYVPIGTQNSSHYKPSSDEDVM